MTREERLQWLEQIEKDIHVCSLESTFADDMKSCAIHSVIEELKQEPCEDCVSALNRVMEYTYGMLTAEKIGLQHLIKSMLDDLPSVTPQEPKAGWIPVSERSPEEDGEYLVTFDDGIVMTFDYSNKYGWYYDDGARIKGFDDVTAWMPLPEPYGEREGNE